MDPVDGNVGFAYLVGAGLADPDGVRAEPLVFVAEPTESRDGLDGVTVVTRRVGMRDEPSSAKAFISIAGKNNFFKLWNSPLLFRDKLDPCREPLRLNGREFGLELPFEALGVIPVLQRENKSSQMNIKIPLKHGNAIFTLTSHQPMTFWA